MSAYDIVVAIHVVAGTAALACYWIAAALRKGSTRHRQVGRVYLCVMLAVVLSGIPLAFAALAAGHPVSASFLGFLLLLVTAACLGGWRAVRLRHDRAAYFGPTYWILAAMLGIAGVAVAWLGSAVGSLLLVVFGGVGIVNAALAWPTFRRARHDPLWWLREHYGAMVGNGIATHIAFLAIGLRNAIPGLDPQWQQALAWFGPLTLGAVATWWLGRRYGRRRPAASTRPAALASGRIAAAEQAS